MNDTCPSVGHSRNEGNALILIVINPERALCFWSGVEDKGRKSRITVYGMIRKSMISNANMNRGMCFPTQISEYFHRTTTQQSWSHQSLGCK